MPTDALASAGDEGRFEAFREILLLLARCHMDRRLRGKVDPEDIVQQVMLRAHAAASELRDDSPLVLSSWLRKILATTLADTLKHYFRDCRDIHLERSIANDIERSTSGLQGWLEADQTSPSMQAARNEEFQSLARAMNQLPADMREVIELKHLKNMSVQEISELLGRSTASIAGLLRRGLAKLREIMGDAP
jgi:RNA polymerase sigma-70 factor (ECF subfamily)